MLTPQASPSIPRLWRHPHPWTNPVAEWVQPGWEQGLDPVDPTADWGSLEGGLVSSFRIILNSPTPDFSDIVSTSPNLYCLCRGQSKSPGTWGRVWYAHTHTHPIYFPSPSLSHNPIHAAPFQNNKQNSSVRVERKNKSVFCLLDKWVVYKPQQALRLEAKVLVPLGRSED